MLVCEIDLHVGYRVFVEYEVIVWNNNFYVYFKSHFIDFSRHHEKM